MESCFVWMRVAGCFKHPCLIAGQYRPWLGVIGRHSPRQGSMMQDYIPDWQLWHPSGLPLSIWNDETWWDIGLCHTPYQHIVLQHAVAPNAPIYRTGPKKRLAAHHATTKQCRSSAEAEDRMVWGVAFLGLVHDLDKSESSMFWSMFSGPA